MEEKATCNQCGENFKSVGRHWAFSNECSIPNFTEKQIEIITGILMGDGWIHTSYDENYNPRLKCEMQEDSLPYLNHLDFIFGDLSLGVELKRTSSEKCDSLRRGSFVSDPQEENYSDSYLFSTRRHPQLKEFDEWYNGGTTSDRVKVWPFDSIELTPTVLKHYYVGDGHWSENKNRIQITMTNNFRYENEVQDLFSSVGLPISNFNKHDKEEYKMMIAEFTVETSEKFFEYMGNPLPGFEYKWKNNEGDY